jgi:hypothetical protein
MMKQGMANEKWLVSSSVGYVYRLTK